MESSFDFLGDKTNGIFQRILNKYMHVIHIYRHINDLDFHSAHVALIIASATKATSPVRISSSVTYLFPLNGAGDALSYFKIIGLSKVIYNVHLI